MSFQAFAITLRPKGGIIEDDLDAVSDYFVDKVDYYNVVTEMEGDRRHMHASFYFKKPMRKCNLNLALSRLRVRSGRYSLRNQWESMDSIWKVACKIKIIYNDGWEKYLEKDEKLTRIDSKMPEDDKIIEAMWAKPNSIPKKQTSPWFHKMEKLWYEMYDTGDDVQYNTVGDFLFVHMYDLRTINVIKNDKDIRAAVVNLCRFIKRAKQIDIDQYPGSTVAP